MTNTKPPRSGQHTPGPWVAGSLSGHVRGPLGEFYEISFHHGTKKEGNRSVGHIATVSVGHWTEEARDLGKANARLIAAAPELLEACQRLLRFEPSEGENDILLEDRLFAEKAIAKAEGLSK